MHFISGNAIFEVLDTREVVKLLFALDCLNFCMNVLYIMERGGVERPFYFCAAAFFSLQFCQCLLLLFGGSVIWCICFEILFLDELTLLSLYNELFCLLKQV